MNYFKKDAKCSICKHSAGISRYRLPKVVGGWICKECYKKCRDKIKLKDATIPQIRKIIKQKEFKDKKMKAFNFEAQAVYPEIEFDNDKRLWKIPRSKKIYKGEDIEDFYLVQNGKKVDQEEFEKISKQSIIKGLFDNDKIKIKELNIKVIMLNNKNEISIDLYNSKSFFSKLAPHALYAKATEIMNHFSVLT